MSPSFIYLCLCSYIYVCVHISMSMFIYLCLCLFLISRKVLSRSGSIGELVAVKWDLAITMLAAWLLLFICLIKGIKSSGKVNTTNIYCVYKNNYIANAFSRLTQLQLVCSTPTLSYNSLSFIWQNLRQ